MRELFLNLGLAFFPVSATLAGLWLSARARARKAEETIRQIALGAHMRAGVQSPSAPDVAIALDAIALEVERIGEGQRFTTKLLSERQDAGRIPASGRVITPH